MNFFREWSLCFSVGNDEVHFHLCGADNSDLSTSLKLLYCVQYPNLGSLALIFFKDNMRTITVTAERYVSMLEKFLWTWTRRIKWDEPSGRHLVPTEWGYGHIPLEFQRPNCDKCSQSAWFLWRVTWSGLHAHQIYVFWCFYLGMP